MGVESVARVAKRLGNGQIRVMELDIFADKTYLALSLEATKLSKKIVTDAFDELGIEYLPTQANFIFHKTKKGVDYKAKMAEAHIMVGRAFPPYDDWNRLTLGTPGEMKAFVKVLKDFRKKGWI